MNEIQIESSRPSGVLEDLVVGLVSQNAVLQRNAASLEELNANVSKQNNLLKEQVEALKKIHWNVSQVRLSTEITSRMVSRDFLDQAEAFLADRMVGLIDTVNIVKERKLSLSRYGDGEIRLMFSPGYSVGFQQNSLDLRRGLFEAINYAAISPDKLMIAVPPILRDPIWKSLFVEHWEEFRDVLLPLKSLGNSHISRPRIFQNFGSDAVEAWSSVWQGQKVTVVTGEGSRFALAMDLFASARSVDFCYSTPKDAFADLPRIIETLQQDNSDIILISLGPAGTVLAAELAKRDRWALDIGHISSSYSQVYEGSAAPEMMSIQIK